MNRIKISKRLTVLLSTTAVLAGLGLATAAPARAMADRKDDGGKKDDRRDDRKADLQERFKKRHKQFRELKEQGLIGETADGLLQPVKDKKLGGKDRDLVDEENADRKELYRIIAEEQQSTPAQVAKVNGKRNEKNLKPGEWYRTEDGDWKQRR